MLLSILAILLNTGIHSLILLVIMQTVTLLGQEFSRSTIHRSCLVIQMAMVSTTHHRPSIQVVFIHQIHSTVLIPSDLHQGPIQILVAQQSKAVGPLGKHFPSTNIITILDLTVKGVQDILLELIHTTVKVVTTNCLQTLPILLASRFKARLLKLGHTLAHMPLHSSNGLLVNNLHKILMEIQCVLLILLHGQGRAQVHLRHTSPRNSAHHLLDQNPR
ncbi:unnamed protein product [Knipowitschia caucasica]